MNDDREEDMARATASNNDDHPFNFTDEDYRYIFDQDPPENTTRRREQDDSVMSDVQPSNLGRQLDAVQSETMENEMDDRQFLEAMLRVGNNVLAILMTTIFAKIQ